MAVVPLLAKSGRGPVVPGCTLVGHTEYVLHAADALFGAEDAPTRLAFSWLRFHGLQEADFARFRRHLRVAAAAHDWGKANKGFQDAVLRRGEQVLRHEHLSGMILAEPSILAWLSDSGLDPLLILSPVVCHHLKASADEVGVLLPGTAQEAVFLGSEHPDFAAIWGLIQSAAGCPGPPLNVPRRWSKHDVPARRKLLCDFLSTQKSRLNHEPDRRLWLSAVRSALILADALGSAQTRLPEDLTRWARSRFANLLTGDQIQCEVINRRVAHLRSKGRWDDAMGFTEFQRGIAGQGPRVLLTAPCGSGKTLAAWNWIRARLDDRPAARVIFLYPTRATATEGFRDYVSWAPEDDAGLLSGTADFELQGMFESPDDDRSRRDYRIDARLYSLGYWGKRIFSATADQFLPFLTYNYGPLCLSPLLAESILVVDEVHSFDRSMFSTLKRFLNAFSSIPVLCMTATLPKERRHDLVHECGLRPFPETPPHDLALIAQHPRYHVEWADRAQAQAHAHQALADGKRVLWVSNRVDDCREVFDRFQRLLASDPETEDIPVLCYHSRFKLLDRKQRHDGLVRAFHSAGTSGSTSHAAFGATTQVCEMSLDLDADVLISELAPMESLIQRMGRCNRDPERVMTRPPGHVYVLRREEGKEKPYDRAELVAAEGFVRDLAGEDVSQERLERLFEKHDHREVEPARYASYLDSGPYAKSKEQPFRETDDFTVPCVLDDDVEKVLAAIEAKSPIEGYIVPVPHYLARPEPRLPHWLSVAEGCRYDAFTGFDGRVRPAGEGGRE